MKDEHIEDIPRDREKAGGKAGEEENFAEMLARSVRGERLHPGQRVRGKVVSVSGDFVYIDLGGKSEGVVYLAEFANDKGVNGVCEGDEVEASFVGVQDGLMRLTTLVGGYSAVTLNAIRDAYEAGVPVNGEVKRELKGGFEVSVGGVRCFCPFSHMDLRRAREGEVYVGRTFPFRVLECGEDGRKIVLSRRAILEAEEEERLKKLKESLATGMEVEGKVKAVQNFGAFVDLGGVDGLIPASEMSWDRSISPGSLLTAGQSISAKVISLDWENRRITLSMKAMQPDPWASVAEKYPVDSRVGGTVVRLVSFGAFVRLEPGVEGLVHISNLGAGRRINHPREVLQEGQLVEVYVLSVDRQNRKLSLSMEPKAEPVKVVLPGVGEVLDGTVERIMPYGVFLKINNGITGLVPNVEMGTPPGTDHKRTFPPGTEMRVAVIDVDGESNKVRLSRKAALERAAQEEFNEYRESLKSSVRSPGGFGSLGDILKAKLDEKEKQS